MEAGIGSPVVDARTLAHAGPCPVRCVALGRSVTFVTFKPCFPRGETRLHLPPHGPGVSAGGASPAQRAAGTPCTGVVPAPLLQNGKTTNKQTSKQEGMTS